MARPRTKDDDALGDTFSCRMNPHDSAVIKTSIARSGLSRSDFLRAALLGTKVHARSTVSVVTDPALIAQVKGAVNNINQFTKLAHVHGAQSQVKSMQAKVDLLCRWLEREIMKAL